MNSRPAVSARAVAAVCAVMFCSSLAAQPTTTPRMSVAEEFVRITFLSFKHALLAKDGARAARYIDDDTAAFYDEIRLSVLHDAKAPLLKKKLSFQTAVLSVRQTLSKAD